MSYNTEIKVTFSQFIRFKQYGVLSIKGTKKAAILLLWNDKLRVINEQIPNNLGIKNRNI